MGKRHKSTIACDISPKVRREVTERDEGQCIICGTTQNIQIAHYISRARLGLGIPQNLACMCLQCHFNYDQGKKHHETKRAFRDYLRGWYEDWCEEDLVYRKGL